MKKVTIDNNSLAHTKWDCKYHIVFAPKYRRKVFYEEKRAEIREILRQLCQWKGVEIVEGEVCPDHIHLLLSIPPKMSVSVLCKTAQICVPFVQIKRAAVNCQLIFSCVYSITLKFFTARFTTAHLFLF